MQVEVIMRQQSKEQGKGDQENEDNGLKKKKADFNTF